MGSPNLSRAEIKQQLENGRREPFLELLADFIDAKPDQEALAQFARKSPDRWAQSIAIFAKPAGYNDRVEVDMTLAAKVQSMPDAELLRRLRELETAELPMDAETVEEPAPRSKEPGSLPALDTTTPKGS